MQQVLNIAAAMLYNLKSIFHSIKTAPQHMVEESKGPKKYKPEELMSRFRSKEDLYRYLTQQGKCCT